eukprot:m.294755 g.294755  ORF g.294755 m.294755 type:complete len:54 (+) comp16389_c0_seq110:4108-4269(+)
MIQGEYPVIKILAKNELPSTFLFSFVNVPCPAIPIYLQRRVYHFEQWTSNIAN